MSERYFVDLDIHGEVIRFYPDDGKTRLHQNDACRIPVESVAFVRERAIAEAVASERERCAKVCEAHSNSVLCSAMIGGPDAEGLQHISNAHQRAAISIRSAAE